MSDFFNRIFNLPEGAWHGRYREHGFFARMPVVAHGFDVYFLFTNGSGNKTCCSRNISGMESNQVRENKLSRVGQVAFLFGRDVVYFIALTGNKNNVGNNRHSCFC